MTAPRYLLCIEAAPTQLTVMSRFYHVADAETLAARYIHEGAAAQFVVLKVESTIRRKVLPIEVEIESAQESPDGPSQQASSSPSPDQARVIPFPSPGGPAPR